MQHDRQAYLLFFAKVRRKMPSAQYNKLRIVNSARSKTPWYISQNTLVSQVKYLGVKGKAPACFV